MMIPKHHSEEWNIFFDGDIDFKVDNQFIFNKFEIGDNAKVSYKEKYNSTYKKNKYKEKELVKRELIGHQFIDAERIK